MNFNIFVIANRSQNRTQENKLQFQKKDIIKNSFLAATT